jgi:hypothetical protein
VIPITGIQFEAGTTSAVLEGSLEPGERKGFALRAGQGYALIAKLESADTSGIRLSIFGEDGQTMPASTRPDGAFLASPLPANQRYFVIVSDSGQGSSFTLLVEIPALLSVSPSGGSASAGGGVMNGRPVTYQVRVQAGQTLSAALVAPAGEAALHIEGLQDGQVLLHRDQAATNWTGAVPATQDYLIRAVPTGETAAFTLQIEINP